MNIFMNKKYLSEFLGTFFLLATVVGSGIMADRLSSGNEGLALLANSIATGCILYVAINIFIPISGAHFNPVVSLIMLLKDKITYQQAIIFMALQILGGILGVRN